MKAALDLLFYTQISKLQVSKSFWKEDQSEEKRRNFRRAWQTIEYEALLFHVGIEECFLFVYLTNSWGESQHVFHQQV